MISALNEVSSEAMEVQGKGREVSWKALLKCYHRTGDLMGIN